MKRHWMRKKKEQAKTKMMYEYLSQSANKKRQQIYLDRIIACVMARINSTLRIGSSVQESKE